jgi:hypothetical protein
MFCIVGGILFPTVLVVGIYCIQSHRRKKAGFSQLLTERYVAGMIWESFLCRETALRHGDNPGGLFQMPCIDLMAGLFYFWSMFMGF